MNRLPRHEQILKLVRASGFMPIEELARLLDVTPQTIRRDINTLSEENLLRRFHGGAALGPSVENEEYATRKVKNQAEKTRIAKLVAEHVPDDCSLFMSIGTTIEAVARELIVNHQHLRVITNNLNIATIITRRPDFEVIITGGVVRSKDGGLTGMAPVDMIEQFKVDYVIMGANGIDNDGTLLDYDYREVRATKAMMNNARQRFLVVDSSKFGRNAMMKVCHIGEMNALFTDDEPPAELMPHLNENSVRLFVVEGQPTPVRG
ncbi:MAG: DeoR/GlpR family DNA-binding transcription regulator [Microvirgula sp.]